MENVNNDMENGSFTAPDGTVEQNELDYAQHKIDKNEKFVKNLQLLMDPMLDKDREFSRKVEEFAINPEFEYNQKLKEEFKRLEGAYLESLKEYHQEEDEFFKKRR